MKIVDVVTQAVNIPYLKPWVISGGPTSVAANVIVKIYDDDNHVGVGEAAPVPAYSYETQQTVMHIINDFLKPVLLGRDPRDLESLNESMDRAIQGHPFAKAAVDLALHDLVAKSLGIPVYQMLGGCYRKQVPIIAGIGLGSTEDRVKETLAFVEQGYQEIKLKIGKDPNLDLEQVGAVRAAVGPEIRIRVDVNQGYRSAYALPVLKKLEKFDLVYIEQPLPTWDIAGIAQLARALDTPIMADESAFSPEGVLTLIRYGAVDMINIKIMKSGLRKSKAIAAIAEAAGLSCMVGSMVELGIGTAAGIHFACATRSVTHACEMIGPLMLESDVLVGEPFSTVPEDHAWCLPDGPGWGVTLKEEYR